MEPRKKAILFKLLLGVIATFDREQKAKLTTEEVEKLSVDFEKFLKRFFKRLGKRE
jgi:hypothetical protein